MSRRPEAKLKEGTTYNQKKMDGNYLKYVH